MFRFEILHLADADAAVAKEVPAGDTLAGGEDKMIDKLLKTFGGKVVG